MRPTPPAAAPAEAAAPGGRSAPADRFTQWIEVDRGALAANLRTFRANVGGDVLLAVVVKSNGYGHGLEIAAHAFAEAGADLLCTHSFAEAEAVAACDLGVPVLILGPLAPGEVAAAVAAGHQITVYDPDRLRQLEAAAAALRTEVAIHLKVETGTNRQGVDEVGLGACVDVLKRSEHLRLEGLHSHFANIEDTTNHTFAAHQLARFHQYRRSLQVEGLKPRHCHMACSAAAALFPDTHFDLVRLGISAYGYWSSRETLVSARQRGKAGLQLRPALTWKVAVAQVKEVPAGAYVGYGCSWKAEVDTRLAVLPVGYADGYRRGLGGKAHVLLQGRRCPVRGRICMNLCMVDVTHLQTVEVGEEAILLGRQGGESLSAETLADWAGTLHYEILAGIGPHLPRLTV